MKLGTVLQLIGSGTLITLTLILLAHLNGLPDRQRYAAVAAVLFIGLAACLIWFVVVTNKAIEEVER